MPRRPFGHAALPEFRSRRLQLPRPPGNIGNRDLSLTSCWPEEEEDGEAAALSLSSRIVDVVIAAATEHHPANVAVQKAAAKFFSAWQDDSYVGRDDDGDEGTVAEDGGAVAALLRAMSAFRGDSSLQRLAARALCALRPNCKSLWRKTEFVGIAHSVLKDHGQLPGSASLVASLCDLLCGVVLSGGLPSWKAVAERPELLESAVGGGRQGALRGGGSEQGAVLAAAGGVQGSGGTVPFRCTGWRAS